jgi:hypothetical protein
MANRHLWRIALKTGIHSFITMKILMLVVSEQQVSELKKDLK